MKVKVELFASESGLVVAVSGATSIMVKNTDTVADMLRWLTKAEAAAANGEDKTMNGHRRSPSNIRAAPGKRDEDVLSVFTNLYNGKPLAACDVCAGYKVLRPEVTDAAVTASLHRLYFKHGILDRVPIPDSLKSGYVPANPMIEK